MTNQQGVPEALRLAEQYDHGDPAAHGNAWKAAVCNELRRLHSEVTTLQAELAAMRAGGGPVAEMVPCYTPSGKRVAVISRFQHLPIGTKLYTSPPAVAGEQTMADVIAACNGTEAFGLIMGLREALQGAVSMAKDAHGHWDEDRDAKVGKHLLALAGANKGYDKRADAIHAALAAQGEKP